MAKTPETSDYSSVKERVTKACGGRFRKQHSHLKPLRSQGQNPETAIPFALGSYFELVDWTGRIVRQDKRGHIPENLPLILDRLKIDPNEWLKTMSWNNRFRRAVGRLGALKAYAKQSGKRWLHGMCCSQSMYLQ